MPYTRKGKCVYNKETGSKKGCSTSVDKANDYMKALYASEIKEYLLEKKKPEGLTDKEIEKVNYIFQNTIKQNHRNLAKNYGPEADRTAYGAAVNKVTKKDLAEYRDAFFNFRNKTNISTNLITPIDNINEMRLLNPDLSGKNISDIYDDLVSNKQNLIYQPS